MVKGSESYELLAGAFMLGLEKINKLIKKEVFVGEVLVEVEFFLCGDYKMIMITSVGVYQGMKKRHFVPSCSCLWG